MKNKGCPDEVVLSILDSDLSDQELAELHNISPRTVYGIRTNKFYKHVRPDIQRRKVGQKCNDCLHYDGTGYEHTRTAVHSCSFGFPDILSLGVNAANTCNYYLHRPKSK
jgi:hypothetical protein